MAKGVKGAASGAAGMLPYVGDVKDAQEVITGKDLIAGKKLSKGERIVTGAAAIIPIVSGPMLRTAGKGVKIAEKKAPKAIKSAEKAGSKAVKKAAPKAVTKADDVIKAARKAVIKKGETVKDAAVKGGKKIETVVKKNVGEPKSKVGNVHNIGKTNNPVINHMEKKVPNDEVFAPSKRGNAPISKKDGREIEIHHNAQDPQGPFREMHPSEHRYGENYKKNHEHYTRKSKIDRTQFRKWRKEYWENEWDGERWK